MQKNCSLLFLTRFSSRTYCRLIGWSATIFSHLDSPRMKKKCYLCGMFVEKKQNKSGSIFVRIIHKVHGKRKCVKVIGYSSDAEEALVAQLPGTCRPAPWHLSASSLAVPASFPPPAGPLPVICPPVSRPLRGGFSCSISAYNGKYYFLNYQIFTHIFSSFS